MASRPIPGNAKRPTCRERRWGAVDVQPEREGEVSASASSTTRVAVRPSRRGPQPNRISSCHGRLLAEGIGLLHGAGGKTRPRAEVLCETPANASRFRRHSWNVNRSNTSIPDRELVELVVRDGDETAFRLLYRRHAPGLRAFVRRYAPDEDVEDVAQEAWLRAVRALPSFRWESSFRTWLIGIGFNAAREAKRRRPAGLLLAGDATVSLAGARPAAHPAAADRIDLERAIRELPPGYRAVLLLHDVEGFTHPEIGRLLDITAGTARSQLHHARKAIRAMLAPKVTHERP